MKLSEKEKQMKEHTKHTLTGPGCYRNTMPAALEVNVFAGKKRVREEPKDSDESEREE